MKIEYARCQGEGGQVFIQQPGNSANTQPLGNLPTKIDVGWYVTVTPDEVTTFNTTDKDDFNGKVCKVKSIEESTGKIVIEADGNTSTKALHAQHIESCFKDSVFRFSEAKDSAAANYEDKDKILTGDAADNISRFLLESKPQADGSLVLSSVVLSRLMARLRSMLLVVVLER